jgi:hypothetical protein
VVTGDRGGGDVVFPSRGDRRGESQPHPRHPGTALSYFVPSIRIWVTFQPASALQEVPLVASSRSTRPHPLLMTRAGKYRRYPLFSLPGGAMSPWRRFVNSPITVPAGATVTGVNWQFNLSSYPSNLTRQLCNNQRCETLWTFGGNSGTSTYFNGDPANNSWYHRFVLVFGSGSSLINSPVYAYTHNVTVTYQY